ncbi:MAG TPA: tetratricopeptide repeat protein [Pyrinomonadaceae bacterium]|nr:tetratricopeptide repeat protein [Pyrinomonadaceae bacterium]
MAQNEVIYYDFFDFRLDVKEQILLKNNEPVQLTHKAFQILLILVQNSGQITKKEDIFDELWSDSFVEEANLTQYIYILRKALGQTPDGQSFIETVPKKGYRFTLNPEQISVTKETFVETPEITSAEIGNFPHLEIDEDLELNDAKLQYFEPGISYKENKDALNIDEADKLAAQTGFWEIVRQSLLSRPLLVILALILFFGVIGAAGVYYFQQKPEPQANVFNIRSIAVLPFKAIGEEIDKEKFGLGMADAIIMKLSRLQQIVVRPTSAVFRYTDRPAADAVSAGRELGVDAVLEGTTQSNGERVKVSVQLVRVADGKPLWAESFQEETSDIFSVQDSISAKVATALSLNLTKQQEQFLSERATTSTEAFEAYQLGIYFGNRRTKEDLLKAVEYFEQAIKIDPNFAQAYAGLADSYSVIAFYRYADVGEMKEKARIAAEKALSLNDSVAEAYVALAMVNVVEAESYAKAKELLERALTIAPYNASARHRYGWVLLANGKVEEAVREMRLAREYDPLSPAVNRALCNALILQRNFPEAVKQCEKSVEISLDTPNSRISLARAYFYNGRFPDALNQLRIQISGGSPNEVISARAKLAYYYAKLGQTDEAEKIYDELKKRFDKDPARAPDLTLISFELGEKDEALVYFKRMLENRAASPDLRLYLTYEPEWDEIKADPQFAPLIPK